MTSRNKRPFQVLKQELSEIDYWNKLSPEEKKYMRKFLFEYYQGDFDEDSIHPKEMQKECFLRYNASIRQMHSVGELILNEAIDQAYKAQGNPGTAYKYYLREDYATYQDTKDNEHDIIEAIDSFPKEPL